MLGKGPDNWEGGGKSNQEDVNGAEMLGKNHHVKLGAGKEMLKKGDWGDRKLGERRCYMRFGHPVRGRGASANLP